MEAVEETLTEEVELALAMATAAAMVPMVELVEEETDSAAVRLPGAGAAAVPTVVAAED